MDHLSIEVGIWIKSKRGHRPRPRAISDLEQSRSFCCSQVCQCHFFFYLCNKFTFVSSITMMASTKISVLLLMVILISEKSHADARFFEKLKTDSDTMQVLHDSVKKKPEASHDENFKSRAIFRLNDESIIRDTLKANNERKNSFLETSTFDSDVLNKFLDGYVDRIKSTTERSVYSYPYRITSQEPSVTSEINNSDTLGVSTTSEDSVTIHGANLSLEGHEALNDTNKRNKFYNANSNDDRNGWVSLEAIPWSKSKISKWQANPSSQRPWPDNSNWDRPNQVKPWSSDYGSRPQYDNNKPWYEKPFRPEYQSDRPVSTSRPSYLNDRYDSNSNQAQKWPPERPNSSWDKYSNNHRPNDDIITDDRPSNFPTSNWDKYDQTTRPTYPSHNDRFTHNSNNNEADWPGLHYPNKFNNIRDKPFTTFTQRPHFSGQYEYENRHPPSHPSNGEGEWILLSTNRGYSKSRQRALKFQPTVDDGTSVPMNGTKSYVTRTGDPAIAVMTSKRQVRLTVLPSINGTNTTTSHGGLLEVEKTFKTVDESQKEFVQAENYNKILKKRPLRHTISRSPLNTGVLAAVSAGMLPATMAMMLPMMLGRKKRSSPNHFTHHHHQYSSDDNSFLTEQRGKSIDSI